MSLTKIVDLDSFYQDDEPRMHLVTPGQSLSGLTKRAAHAEIDHFITHVLRPDPSKFYLHINAMGAGEYYGSNKNGDYFPEDQLIQHCKTFEEHGHVFRHHINDDPAKSIGKVLFAVYNRDMHRIEVVEEVDREKGKDILERIARGDYPSTSMACKTPWDVCSICNNKAHSTAAYCQHLKTEMNRIYPNGQRVMALNLGPLKFFDMSFVLRPADVTSSALRKVAHVVGAVPGAILAEEAGMGDHTKIASHRVVTKEAALRKMSDLIKKIPGGTILQGGKILNPILKSIKPLGPECVAKLRTLGDFSAILNALAELHLVPSLEFLAELIAQEHGVSPKEEVGKQVGAAISSISLQDIPQSAVTLVPEVREEPANRDLLRELSKYLAEGSIHPSAVEKRAYFTEDIPFGYVPSPGVQYGSIPPIRPAAPPPSASILDHILALAGGALVARFLLHSLVAAKSGLKSGYDAGQVKYAHTYPVVESLLDGVALADLSRLKQ